MYNSGVIRYFKNTSWMLIENILRILGGLVVGIWIAKYLGPEEFGIYSYALSFIAITSSITKLGLDSIIVKELLNNKKQNIILGTAFWLKFLSSLSVIALLIFFLTRKDSSINENIYINILLVGLIFQSFDVISFYFESQVKLKIVSICKIIQLIFSINFKIYLIYINSSLIWFVLAYTVDLVLLAIIYVYSYNSKVKIDFYNRFDFNVAKKMLRNSWPLILSSLSVIMITSIDKIMIKQMLGASSAGIYTASVKFPEAISFLPTILAISLYPAIINAKLTSKSLYEKRIKMFYFLMTWLGIIITMIFNVLAEELLNLYGDSYKNGKNILIIYSISTLFIFQWIARGRWLIAENLQVYNFYIMSCGALINIVLNYYLIDIFNMIGAAYASLITYFLVTLVLPILFKKTRKSSLMLLKSFFTWKY